MLTGSVQVSVVASQEPERQLGPFVGSQLIPVVGRSTQVLVAASQTAYEKQALLPVLQAAPSPSFAVQVIVVGSQRSWGLLHPREPLDGLHAPPVPTGLWQVFVAMSQKSGSMQELIETQGAPTPTGF